jgi:hypothetical protein
MSFEVSVADYIEFCRKAAIGYFVKRAERGPICMWLTRDGGSGISQFVLFDPTLTLSERRAFLTERIVADAIRERHAALAILTRVSVTFDSFGFTRAELLVEVSHRCGVTADLRYTVTREGLGPIEWSVERREPGSLPRISGAGPR